MSAFTTVPLRCPACGEQTHKTLAAVLQDHGFVCQCGVRSDLDIEKFEHEIRKSEGAVRKSERKS